MTGQRKTREQDSRKETEKPSDKWVPPSLLPMPEPQEGWAFRYIRVANHGKADTRNVSQRFREGWKPVVASEHPELEGKSDIGSEYPEGVEIGGLLLCKIPAATMEARKKYYADMSSQQLESVEKNYLSDQDPRMPKHNDSKSRTDFRRG